MLLEQLVSICRARRYKHCGILQFPSQAKDASEHIDGSVQDFIISSTLAMEIP